MSGPVPDAFDPLVTDEQRDPHELYRGMRARCPVAHSDRFDGFWALTRYDDIRTVLTDPATFITSEQNVVPAVAFTGRRPPLHLDPPEHRRYRQPLSPIFGGQRVARLEPELRRLIAELLDPLIARGRGDFGIEVAVAFPVHAFAHVLNVPVELMERINDIAVRYNGALQDADHDEVKRQSLALYEVAHEVVAARERTPGDPAIDPTTALLQARPDGEPLPRDMVVGTVRQVLVVGIIAPSVVLGSIVKHLAEDGDLQGRLRREPALIPAAIEEFLRLYSPYRGFARTATKDVELGGVRIPKGDPIAMVFTSADRDEAVFDDPDSFDLDRAADHLAFGLGPHRCPGAPFARLQLRVALEELLARTHRFERDGPVTMTRWPEYGVRSLPLRVESQTTPRADRSRSSSSE